MSAPVTASASRFDAVLGPLAAACCVVAVLAFGAAFDGYSHAQHPLAMLGARGVPGAWAYNLLVFVGPGVLAALIAWRLRSRLPGDTGWAAGIGSSLLLLSALAFAAQGLLPLDPNDLDGPVSQWHAACWTLWWLAFAPGAALLACGLWRHWRRLAVLAALAAMLTLVLNWAAGVLLPGPIAQRLLLLVWWGPFLAACLWRPR